MWLKLNLSGIRLSMQIRNYRRTSEEDWLSVWCKTDFSFVADKWLNYCEDDSEVFLAREIEDLAKSLDDLLNDRLTAPTEFNCMRPNRRRFLLYCDCKQKQSQFLFGGFDYEKEFDRDRFHP